MDYLHALVLAAVQGLTEFLPVSSSAHLILVPELLGWPDQGLAFDVAVHVGTLLAVVFYLRHRIAAMVVQWCQGWVERTWSQEGLLAWWVIISTIPVGFVGLVAGDWIEFHLRSALVIAAATFGFALLLAWADARSRAHNDDLNDLSAKQALWVGCAQALALIPGTSRSGITMTAMLAMGYSRVVAAEFSFLLAVPAIALPGLLKTQALMSADTAVRWEPLLVGVAVSAALAFACMRWFMRWVARIGMRPFVIYRIVLALVIVTIVGVG